MPETCYPLPAIPKLKKKKLSKLVFMFGYKIWSEMTWGSFGLNFSHLIRSIYTFFIFGNDGHVCYRSHLQHYLIYDMCTVLPLPKPKIFWFCIRTYRLLFLCPLWRQENRGTKRLGNIHEVRARKCQGQDSVRAGWLQTLFPWPLCFPVSTLRFITENKQLALFWWGETK